VFFLAERIAFGTVLKIKAICFTLMTDSDDDVDGRIDSSPVLYSKHIFMAIHLKATER